MLIFCLRHGGFTLKKYSGFTLVEVLITITVIGVVAALTLPSVINKFKIKQLEIQFKRTSSNIENALRKTAYEFEVYNFKDFNKICGSVSRTDNAACKTANNSYFDEIKNSFYSQFKIIKTVNKTTLSSIKIKDYSGSAESTYRLFSYCGSSFDNIYILNDGSSVCAMMTFFAHEPSDGIGFAFDTNGPYKGPNRFGYDIFFYTTGSWYKLCTKNQSSIIYNVRGCYDYAIKDKNPDDSAKGYWESLKL